MSTRTTTRPRSSSGQAVVWLLSQSSSNLIWSLLSERVVSGAPGRYWLAEADGDVAGIVMESPPGHRAATSPMRREHADAMAAAISGEGHRLSGIAGEASTGVRVRRLLVRASEDGRGGTGCAAAVLARPPGPAGGCARTAPTCAEVFERELVIEWWSAFQVETGAPTAEVSAAADFGLSTGRLFFWDDGGARCLARATEPLGGISRIGAVFTPPEWRRRGYASACVGALSERVRHESGANSVLYAELGNPSSNAIYRRLGFEAVSEALIYSFVDAVDSE